MRQLDPSDTRSSEVLATESVIGDADPSIVWEDVVAILIVFTPVFLIVYKFVLPTAVGKVMVVVPLTKYT